MGSIIQELRRAKLNDVTGKTQINRICDHSGKISSDKTFKKLARALHGAVSKAPKLIENVALDDQTTTRDLLNYLDRIITHDLALPNVAALNSNTGSLRQYRQIKAVGLPQSQIRALEKPFSYGVEVLKSKLISGQTDFDRKSTLTKFLQQYFLEYLLAIEPLSWSSKDNTEQVSVILEKINALDKSKQAKALVEDPTTLTLINRSFFNINEADYMLFTAKAIKRYPDYVHKSARALAFHLAALDLNRDTSDDGSRGTINLNGMDFARSIIYLTELLKRYEAVKNKEGQKSLAERKRIVETTSLLLASAPHVFLPTENSIPIKDWERIELERIEEYSPSSSRRIPFPPQKLPLTIREEYYQLIKNNIADISQDFNLFVKPYDYKKSTEYFPFVTELYFATLIPGIISLDRILNPNEKSFPLEAIYEFPSDTTEAKEIFNWVQRLVEIYKEIYKLPSCRQEIARLHGISGINGNKWLNYYAPEEAMDSFITKKYPNSIKSRLKLFADHQGK